MYLIVDTSQMDKRIWTIRIKMVGWGFLLIDIYHIFVVMHNYWCIFKCNLPIWEWSGILYRV